MPANPNPIEISENLFASFAELRDLSIDEDKEELGDEIINLMIYCTTKNMKPHTLYSKESGLSNGKIIISTRLYTELSDHVDTVAENYGPDTSEELQNFLSDHTILEKA